MKTSVFLLSLLFSLKCFADSSPAFCQASYQGDESLWDRQDSSVMGMPTGVTEYSCKDCDQGIQIKVSNGYYLSKAYTFHNQDDFLNKIDNEYSKNDIANLSVSDFSQFGKYKFNIKVNQVGITSFTRLMQKTYYLYYKAHSETVTHQDINYIGFVSATNNYTCSIVAVYYGDSLNPKASSALSYFMNNLLL
jgi:hypothetical protein